MIKFPCTCQNELEVPDDLAGGLIQCPRCGRLTDVPTLSELPHLRDDGTIELIEDDSPQPSHREQMRAFQRTYTRSTTDDRGAEIDLRPSPEQIVRAGAPDSEPVPVHRAPRYDPLTGELVRPLEIKQSFSDEPAGPIPVARAALTYSTDQVKHRLTPGRLLLELFMPINMVVMFFVYLLHAASQLLAMVLPLSILIIPLALMIMAHYAIVVESTGPDSHDELPRPLRDVRFGDDLWAPMWRIFLALGLAFGPAIFALVWDPIPDSLRGPLTIGLALAGVALLPALILTTVTGSTLMNLRPDRVAGVIRACGRDYLVSVIGCGMALGIYFLHIFGYYLLPDAWIAAHPWLNGLVHPTVEYTTLGVAVYFGHFFTWHLGIVYRGHHGNFPWILQRHIPKPRPLPRRAQRPPAQPVDGP